MLNVIIFDVDGTLFNTKRGIFDAFNSVLKELNRPVINEDEVDKIIGPPIRDSFKEYYNMTDAEAEKATVNYRKFYISKYIKESKLYNGWQEVLMELKSEGAILGIATMKTLPQINKLLTIFRMNNLFDVVYAAEEDGSLSKTKMLQLIYEKYGPDNKFYMIGDTEGDYKASKVAPYEFILCEFGFGYIEDDNIKRIYTPKELLQIVK